MAGEIPKLRELRGSLGRDAATLRAALDQISAVTLRMNRLWVYASTQSSTDNGSGRNQERMGLMQGLSGQYGGALAWVDPEIIALGAERSGA